MKDRFENYKKNIKTALIIFLIMLFLLGGYMGYALFFYGERWFSSPYNTRVRIHSQEPKIILGDILDRNDTLLVTTKEDSTRGYFRQYSNQSHYGAHVIGFHTESGRSGAEAHYVKYLMGYNNNIFERIYQKAFLSQERGNNIVLTIDIQLSEYIASLLGGSKGSVVLMNPKTGEILSMVSSPSFDPNNMKDIKTDNLLNRSVQGLYPPGSIFKTVVLADALESIDDIDTWTFNCIGSLDVQGKKISCYGGQAHGELDISNAMIHSCNGAFAQLGINMGWQSILKKSGEFGFNKDFLLEDLRVEMSRLNLNKASTDIDIGWTSVGQGTTLVTPMHMAMMISSIANDGIMMEPKLLHSVIGRRGRVLKELEPKKFLKVLEPEDAVSIKQIMTRVVTEGTGRASNVGGLSVAGKTGTAEVKSEKDPNAHPHAWFIGFAPAENPTLAIAVIVENSGTGGKVAAPIAGKILHRARELGY